jgi:hypothetical protein
MNEMTRSASSEASMLIEDFLAANPLPSSEQWKAFILAHPVHASQIADTALMLTLDSAEFDAEELDVELFNATRSAMLNEVHLNSSVPIAAAKTALKVCRGPIARRYAREIGLGERVDLFNQMLAGELSAPYVLVKRLAKSLQVRMAALAEVFALNFQNQPVQSYKADGKPSALRQPVSWEHAVRDAGITGEEAARLLYLEKEMD